MAEQTSFCAQRNPAARLWGRSARATIGHPIGLAREQSAREQSTVLYALLEPREERASRHTAKHTHRAYNKLTPAACKRPWHEDIVGSPKIPPLPQWLQHGERTGRRRRYQSFVREGFAASADASQRSFSTRCGTQWARFRHLRLRKICMRFGISCVMNIVRHRFFICFPSSCETALGFVAAALTCAS